MPRITITVPDKTPQPYRFQLDRQTVSMGRGSENDIAIDCGSVSVKHAEMQRVVGGYELRDVGSTNGIKLDGERSEVIALLNGVSAKLGDVTFDFLLTEEEEEFLAHEKPAEDSRIYKEPSAFVPEIPPIRENFAEPDNEMEEEKEGGGLWRFLMFVLVLLLAFFIGMAIHFKKDTGGSLIDAIKAKSEAIKR
jgi:pSer/pThr/pTyr-binding forkhead associated (FHA) protein